MLSGKAHYKAIYRILRDVANDPFEFDRIMDYISDKKPAHEIVKNAWDSFKAKYTDDPYDWHGKLSMKNNLKRKHKPADYEADLDDIPF
jgi:NADH:ubiquinone oxidoreductase subunit